MKVHQLIEILKRLDPNAEVIVGSHTLNHPSCNNPVGVWPAFAVETGEFVHGGPLGDQNNWVKIRASDVWGCTHFQSDNYTIKDITTIKHQCPVCKSIPGDNGISGCAACVAKWASRDGNTGS